MLLDAQWSHAHASCRMGFIKIAFWEQSENLRNLCLQARSAILLRCNGIQEQHAAEKKDGSTIRYFAEVNLFLALQICIDF